MQFNCLSIRPVQTFLFLLLLSLCQCSNQKEIKPETIWNEIAGREDSFSTTRPLLYRICTPTHWIYVAPSNDVSLQDTTKPICEFFIQEGNESIRITIHNFPSENLEDRIPPQTQVARWQRQFASLDTATMTTLPQAFGGFAGLFFEGSGILHAKEMTMMGWSMQLAPELYRTIKSGKSHAHQQAKSDYTIKIVGEKLLMAKYRKKIITFARSFELINPI